MEITQDHIINQLRLEVEVGNQHQSFRVRHQLSGYWQEWLLGHLEETFNRLSGTDEIVKIEKLEIDLGEVFLDDFENQFKTRFYESLDKALGYKFSGLSSEITKINSEISDLEILAHFIENGHYPWWSGRAKSIKEIFHNCFVKANSGLRSLLVAWLINKMLLTRLIYQIENQLLTDVLVELFDLMTIVILVDKELLRFEKEEEIEKVSSKSRQVILLRVIIECILLREKSNEEIYEMVLLKISSDLAILKKDESHFEHTTSIIDEAGKKGGINENKVESGMDIETNSEDQKILTSHAGLILIAPFLPQFFNNLNLLDKNDFSSEEAQYKAIHLLNYIVTGERYAEEQNISMEKIICGVALSQPVPQEMAFSEIEITEANNLIKAVLAYWKPLNNTSIDGFRTSFLLREGILYNEWNQWKLRVEKKSYDMLLDVITWGFAFIKFSWTTKPIQTEW